MGSFLKNHWVFIFIGFAVMVIAGLGFLVFTRMRQVKQTPTTTEPAQETELSFSVDEQPTGPQCLSLTASPVSGATPLAVTFDGESSGQPDESIVYMFSFGDNETQEIEHIVATDDNVDSESISHTYTAPGSFTASLTIVKDGISSPPCQTTIAVSGVAITQAPSKTPTKAPLSTPTVRQLRPTSASEENVAVPAVPQAGGFIPTAVVAIGGVAIIVVAFLL